MAKKRTKAAPVESVAFDATESSIEDVKRVVFNPKNLTTEQQQAVVEEYMGVHPRFFLYSGLNIKLNHGLFRNHGNAFNGWKPASKRYNSFEG